MLPLGRSLHICILVRILLREFRHGAVSLTDNRQHYYVTYNDSGRSVN